MAIDKNTSREAFEKAGKRIIRQVRDVERIRLSDIDASWEAVEKAVRPPVSKRRRIYRIASIAASVIILLSTGLYFLQQKDEPQLNVALLEEKELPEIGVDDILLVYSDEMLKLKDESFIQYESDGKINVNGETGKDNLSPKEESRLNEIIVPRGKRARLVFSDSTTMYVNSGTRVIYPAVFKKNVREILVDGEVFLDVKRDEARPFIVKTNDMEVRVLGTQFNVNAYRDEPKSSVVLVSGSVEVKNHKGKTLLQPNQLLEIDENNVFVREVEVFGYISWKDNMLLLREESAGNILDRLARYYGRAILYDDEVRKVLSLSGKLDIRETAEEAVEIVCLSLSLHYTVDENNDIVVTLK